MRATIYLIVVTTLCLLLNTGLYGQDFPDVPVFQSLDYEPDGQLLIPVFLNDNNGTLELVLNGEHTSSLDALESYLLTEMKKRNAIYRMRLAVAIVADQNLEMQHLEMLQEELKRLGLLRVFYIGKAEGDDRAPVSIKKGLFYKLPARDEESVHLFYESRQMEPRQEKFLSQIIAEEEIERLRQEKPDFEKQLPPAPLPPPPPPLPKRYDPSTMGDVYGLQTIVIDAQHSGDYLINGDVIGKDEAYTTIAAFLKQGECLFVLRPAAASTYNQYVRIIDAVTLALAMLRNEAAQQQFGKPYDDLGYRNRRTIKRQLPFMIIDEPVYYRG